MTGKNPPAKPISIRLRKTASLLQPYDDAQRAQFKRIINNAIILDSDYAVEELQPGAARDYTVESVSKDTIVIKESVAGALENTRSLILDGKRIKAAFDYDADEGVLTVTINKIKGYVV